MHSDVASTRSPPTTMRSVLLDFDPSLALPHEKVPLRDGLSVALRTGDDLWIASDETTTLERLTQVDADHFARHARFALADYVELPGEVDEEIDVEGIGFDGGYLWITGSHSLTRKKPKRRRDEAENLARLATVKDGPNRYVLARIPCVRDAAGIYALVREAEVAPADGGAPRRLVAARLDGGKHANALTKEIRDDEHLAPFLAIPGKDNGFDIEGLAMSDGRLFLGLRGPVLRGWAVVLSMEVDATAEDPTVLQLSERRVARDDDHTVERAYAKHFIQLGGMGIRELRAVGDDLLVLAGPTMALDGTIAVFRWRGGAKARHDGIVPADAVERLFDVPHGTGEDAERDRAEGMTLWTPGRAEELLVVYDSPSERRKRGDAGVMADVFPLTGQGEGEG